MSARNDWFTIDRAGLAKILRRKGIEFAVFELIQNAWDEAGVTRVDVTLESTGRNEAALIVTDNAPEGFKDLRHAFTLFAESAKKGNAEQRGRFNLGEKLVLALCKYAEINSSTGRVVFGDDTGRRVYSEPQRSVGTECAFQIRMSKAEIERVSEEVKALLPPINIHTTFNGETLGRGGFTVATFEESLPTELADDEGMLRAATRRTEVRVHNPLEGQPARIYEMGIPVVEHDCAFDVDIQQKVPLTIDRENVTPKFLRALHTALYNHTHALLTPEQTTNEWAQTAIESKQAEPAAVQDYMTKRFGEKRVSYDPSDPEANSRAVAEGYTVVHGSMLSREAWSNVREFSAITPAGQIFPTHSKNKLPFEPAEMTPAMHAVRKYARQFAQETLGISISVEFGKQATREAACYGHRELQFNVRNLGPTWFDLKENRERIDDLIIHELGHELESNHLSDGYYRALTKIGAAAICAVREGRL